MKNQFLRLASCGLLFMVSSAYVYAESGNSPVQQEVSKEQKIDLSFLKPSGVFAQAELEPRSDSKARGLVLFAKTPFGIQIIAKVLNVEPGMHGIHIHENGDCSAPDASSAGGHFNPAGHDHGHISFATGHAGDFGNIVVDQDGEGILTLPLSNDMLTGVKDWNEFIGKAIVLHSTQDDLVSQPSGDAGSRIACGVIRMSQGR